MPGAALMAVGSIGAAAIGSSASKGAAKTAANSANYAADQNAALARENRDMLRGYIDPLTGYASAAGDEIAARLGLPGYGGSAGRNIFAQAANDPYSGYTSPSEAPRTDFGALLSDNPDIAAWAGADGDPSNDQAQAAEWLQTYGAKDMEAGLRPALKTTPNPLAAFAARPAAERPAFGSGPGAPNLSEDAFKSSPLYNLGMAEGQANLNSNFGARGLLKSGAAIKGALDFARENVRNNYSTFANTALAANQQAQNMFIADRNASNQNFDVDQLRTDARFDADRGYLTSRLDADRSFNTNRFDTQTNNLFSLAGIGTGAINALAGVGNNYVGTVANSNNARADATGNAAIASANSTNNLFGNAMQGIGYAYGMRGGGQAGAQPASPYLPPNTSYAPVTRTAPNYNLFSGGF